MTDLLVIGVIYLVGCTIHHICSNSSPWSRDDTAFVKQTLTILGIVYLLTSIFAR